MSKLPADLVDIALPPDPPTLQAGNDHSYDPPQLRFLTENSGRPVHGDRAFKFIKNHTLPTLKTCLNQNPPKKASDDPLGCLFVSNKIYGEGTTVGPEMWVAYRYETGASSGGSSIAGPFGSFVTGFINTLGLAVTTIADLWNGAVAGAKSLALDFLIQLPGVGQFCSKHPDTCKKGIDTGVTIALASAGMPPSLPNWNQLKADGKDYVIGVVADEIEEATGVPSEITVDGLNLLADQMMQQMSDGRGGSDVRYDWVQRYLGFDPAVWVVAVQKNGTGPVPSGMVLKRPKNALYIGGDVPVPRRFPPLAPGATSTTLLIPMVLHSRVDDIPMPLCLTDRYGNTNCLPFSWLKEPVCQYESYQGKFVYKTRPCEFTDHVEIYFRDRWTWEKFLPATCMPLSGITMQNVNGIYLANSEATFFVGGAIPPTKSGGWSGPFISACQ
jgi:hypothetical protein